MLTITNPLNNKSYTFNSLFVPLSRLSNVCQNDSHESCLSSAQTLLQKFDFDFVKGNCCLCICHNDKEVN